MPTQLSFDGNRPAERRSFWGRIGRGILGWFPGAIQLLQQMLTNLLHRD